MSHISVIKYTKHPLISWKPSGWECNMNGLFVGSQVVKVCARCSRKHHMVVSISGDTSKMSDLYLYENPIEMDDLGLPPF